jgi:hypothetical protein
MRIRSSHTAKTVEQQQRIAAAAAPSAVTAAALQLVELTEDLPKEEQQH